MAHGAPAHADVVGSGSCQEEGVWGSPWPCCRQVFAEQRWLISAAFTPVLTDVAKLWQFISSLPCNLKLWGGLM